MQRLDPRNALPLRIETERLVLRPPMRADAPAMVRLADNPRIAQMVTRIPSPYTRADAIGYIDIVAQRPDERAYAMTGRDLTFLGIISIHFHPAAVPEIGYWLGEPFWGRGYATEAVRSLVSAAFATGLCPAINAYTLKVNAGSQRVLEKAGFALIGDGIELDGPLRGKSYRQFGIEAPQ